MTDEENKPEDFELGESMPKKTVKKANYTAMFERFWAAYPRKTAKFKAFSSWVNHVDEKETGGACVADVEKRNRMRFWHVDKAKIPMPTTFLNQRRWEDDWEDEVKTRGKETHATYRKMPEPSVDTGPLLSGWETMTNRLMRNYLFKAGGLTDAQLTVFKRVKGRILGQMIPVIDEELAGCESDESKKAMREEMSWMLAKALMNNLDIDLGMNIGAKVIDMSRKTA